MLFGRLFVTVSHLIKATSAERLWEFPLAISIKKFTTRSLWDISTNWIESSFGHFGKSKAFVDVGEKDLCKLSIPVF